jgi:hypothetical protein
VFETQFVERSVSMQVELNETEYYARIVEQLREENALLRNSATTFGALAERLNAALARERGVQARAPDDRVAEDSPK